MQNAESLWHKPLRALKLTEDKTVPAGARGELLHKLLGQQEKLLKAFAQLQTDRRAADGEDGEDEAERQEIMQLWSFGSNQRVTYLLERKRRSLDASYFIGIRLAPPWEEDRHHR